MVFIDANNMMMVRVMASKAITARLTISIPDAYSKRSFMSSFSLTANDFLILSIFCIKKSRYRLQLQRDFI